MEEIDIPPPESAVMVRASLSAILNHMLQSDLAFLRRQGIVVGLGILHLKEEVIILVGLVIVATAFLDLTLPCDAAITGKHTVISILLLSHQILCKDIQ